MAGPAGIATSRPSADVRTDDGEEDAGRGGRSGRFLFWVETGAG